MYDFKDIKSLKYLITMQNNINSNERYETHYFEYLLNKYNIKDVDINIS